MIKQIGTIKEIFIPCDCEDILKCSIIGFIIETNNEKLTLIQEQNDINCDFLVGDKVQIVKRKIDDREFIDMKEYDGDKDE